MDLPTYTNIWRIEKRLYKLYDFRLPAPLPINWIAVFTGITVPYIVLLVAIGLPFNHNLVWLYVLPPGLLTWLTTRPVIESKRLPELLESQIRYLAEPRVWCRLAPLNEKDQIVVTARVWHSRRAERPPKKAGVVALREPGTLARRDDAAAVPAATAAFGATAVAAPAAPGTATTGAPAAPAARAPARQRLRARGASAPERVRSRSAEPRPATQPRSAAGQAPAANPAIIYGQPEASGQGAASPHTPVPSRSPAATQPAVQAQVPARARSRSGTAEPAAKPGRFRIAGLRSRPDGPAPALPPGVALRPPADPWQPRPAGPAQPRPPAPGDPRLAGPAQPGQAGPARSGPRARTGHVPARPAEPVPPHDAAPARGVSPARRPAPSFGPVTAPAPSGPPVHATPDVYPVSSAREPDLRVGAPPIEVSHSERHPLPVPGAPAPAPGADMFADSGAMVPESANKASGDGEPGEAEAPALPPPVVTAVTQDEERTPSIERALSGPSKDRNLSWHGKVKFVAGATQGPGARDQEALDRARARLPLSGPKRVLMLGCTSGAGQTVTTLMTGYIVASLREQPVAAVDLHDGALARHSAPAGWLEEILGGKTPVPRAAARPDGLNPAHRDNPARLDVIASHEPLGDGDERLVAEHLGRHYPLTMIDPGAAGLTKLLTVADQLVVVVPASVEAAGALADTRDWLDAHGFAELAGNSVTLINGVSKRSMADVAHAESVARGRCRAIVRVPWDDMLPVGVTGPSALRPQTRVAYTALAGVLVAGMAAAPIRTK